MLGDEDLNRSCQSKGKVNADSDNSLICFSMITKQLYHNAHMDVLLFERMTDNILVVQRPILCFTHAMWHYTPPIDGGQFDMPNYCISHFPPIAGMIHLKAFSISVLMPLNKMRIKTGDFTVATGPLKYECATLEKAQYEYEI
jgi:hypothetical protein